MVAKAISVVRVNPYAVKQSKEIEDKWCNKRLDISVLKDLKAKTDVFSTNRKNSCYVLFSKSGFTGAVLNEARSDDSILLVDLAELMKL